MRKECSLESTRGLLKMLPPLCNTLLSYTKILETCGHEHFPKDTILGQRLFSEPCSFILTCVQKHLKSGKTTSVGNRRASTTGFLSRLGYTQKGNWKATLFVMGASKKYTKLSQQRIPSASWFDHTCQKLCEVTVLLGPREIEGPVLGMDSFLLSPITATVKYQWKVLSAGISATWPFAIWEAGFSVNIQLLAVKSFTGDYQSW